MHADSLELVPLDCPTCGSSVEAAGADVVFYCISCRNGYRFDEAGNTLEPIEVGFVAAANIAAEGYRPFWLLPARLEIRSREAVGAQSLSGFLQSFFGGRQSQAGAAEEGTFVVPAFHAPLAATTELVRRYTRSLPELGERLGERLLGGCYDLEDAKKLAHFALIAAEVEKPDTLRDLDYGIRFGEARLLGVPFSRDGDTWRDAIHGIRV